MDGTLYQVVTPRVPLRASPEAFTTALHGLLLSFRQRIKFGEQPYVALEIDGADGVVRFYVWASRGSRSLVRSMLRSAYPDSAIKESEHDPQASPDRGYEAVWAYGLKRSDDLPIRTNSPDGDLLGPLLQVLADGRQSRTKRARSFSGCQDRAAALVAGSHALQLAYCSTLQ